MNKNKYLSYLFLYKNDIILEQLKKFKEISYEKIIISYTILAIIFNNIHKIQLKKYVETK